ncbi:PREDICTED: 227 kDa spindle- and centromere-associated protein-like [Dinoponera quadriceps]|uniref:227 kDa spindle- and centromere-associated protein-like n=1 Tax=Dinoponera quadriceps TaxID=609295 RepID=A0A6P3Y4E7_DINQU|nr:PREDICTED: 227 kDa spindle- and centromere-associated protein-like [Dinoponera quadriceps]
MDSLTDEYLISEVKALDERCIILIDEIQQIRDEVEELSEKVDLTEEETRLIEKKQDALLLKTAELDQLTEQLRQITIQGIPDLLYDDSLELDKILDVEKIQELFEEKKIDIEAPKIQEKDRFELPRIKYPEDKYKLEETLLEKDAAIEGLEKKVCGLQAEMRMIVKENKELSSRLATLSQLMTSPTCGSGVNQLPQLTSPPTPPRAYVSSLPREDASCRCKCCSRQPQFTDILSPTTGTVCFSPRLAGGGSATETPHSKDNDMPQNVEICPRGVALTKASPPQGICPAELENKQTTYDISAKQLEQQLGSMECEVRNMQMELANVQRERQQLEQQRKLLKCTGPCAPCACPPPPSTCVTPSALRSISPIGPAAPPMQMTTPAVPPKCTGSCTNAPMGASNCAQQQLRDLREQYARLQEDYKNKLCEVSCMRTDAEKMKQDLRDAKEEKERMEIKMIDAQERLKLFEEERGNFEGHKEQLVEQEQALMVAKQRMRETQDELEELRSATQDLSAQLEDYRNKYLQAQQQVEEQRRQMDLMEMDNARMNENVTLEIGRVKNQFQEKLAELAPLPEILKQSQTKLQETQQMRLIAERNCEDLSRELQGCKDKLQIQQNETEVLRTQYQTLLGERGQGTGRFEEMEKKCGELRNENERMKNTLTRLEEQRAQLQKRMDEKMHENTQLLSQLEQVREESARQVARTKDRCENIRWSMQRQIAEMERELAQCRATARAAQRDRDEIRQKMQGQINNLNEAFEQAQGRIRSLQGHVNYLKTSYSNIFIGQGETPAGVPAGDAPGLGYDSCDCNY